MSITDLATSNLAAPDLALDLGGIESHFQAINNATATWSLPSLPDTVKLDLMMHDWSSSAIGPKEFLHGLDADIAAVSTAPAPQVDTSAYTSPVQPVTQQPQLADQMVFHELEGFEATFQREFSKLAGLQAPRRVTPSAVTDLKAEAIRRGLVPADTPIDGTWGPQWNGVRYDLLDAQFRDVLSGDRPGGLSVQSVMGVLDKWATPTGLIGLAVQLDYLPDVRQIQSEASQWGDKWRKWWKNKTSPRDFVDALTGPIDDIALPVVNTALLLSGVGSSFTFARGLYSAKALEAASTAGNLFTLFGGVQAGVRASTGARLAGTAVKASDLASDIARMQRASLLSSRLTKETASGLSKLVGHGLESWRQLSSVTMTKKLMQTGMKIGFAGRVEQLLLPDRQLGIGFTGTGGTVTERDASFRAWVNQTLDDPAAQALYAVAETALTPTTVFKPGTFTGPLRSTTNRLEKALFGLTAERQLGVQTAVGLIGEIGVDDQQRAALLMNRVRRGDTRNVLIEVLGNGDELKAGEKLAYIGLTSGLHAYATQEAYRTLGYVDEGNGLWQQVYHGYRNSAINRIRGLDIDLATDEGRDAWRALRSSVAAVDEPTNSVSIARKRLWDDLGAIHDPTSPDYARLMAQAEWDVAHHADVRAGTLKEVLAAGAQPHAMAETIQRMYPTLDRWDEYTAALDQLEHTLGFTSHGDELLATVRGVQTGDFLHPALAQDVSEMVLRSNKVLQPDWWDDTLAQIADGRGRLTIARRDAVTAQVAEAYIAHVRELQRIRSRLGAFDEAGMPVLSGQLGQSLEAWARGAGKSIGELTDAEVRGWLDEAPGVYKATTASRAAKGEITRAAAEDWASSVVWAARGGSTPADAHRYITQRLADLENAEDFWSRTGIVGWDSAGRRTIDAKIEALQKRLPFLAKDIAVDPDLAARLAEHGYKPVFGVEFAMPHDVVGLMDGVPAFKHLDLQRRSLGVFFGYNVGAWDLQKDLRRERAMRLLPGLFAEQRQQLDELGKSYDELGAAGAVFGSNPADGEELMKFLFDGRRTMLGDADAAAKVYDQAGLITSIASKAATTGLPTSVYRLSEKQLASLLGEGFSPRAIKTIKRGLELAQNTGFEHRGLLTIEDTFVANSWLRAGLKGMAGGQHPVVTSFDDWSRSAARAFGPLGTPMQKTAAVMAHPIIGIQKFAEQSRANHTVLERVLGAALGGYVGAMSGADESWSDVLTSPNVIGGAAVGGIAGARAVINPRAVVAVTTGLMAKQAAMAAGASPLETGVAAVTGGVLGAVGTKKVAQGGLHFLNSKGWAQYSRLGATARATRDRLRFSLNPIWDLQRYTEGMTQSAIATLPDGVTLPITLRPMERALADARKLGKEITFTGVAPDGSPLVLRGKEAIIASFKEASANRGGWDFNVLDSTQNWFIDRGIMGFTPIEWHASTFHQLTSQGMDADAALQAVNDIYAHALRRTGLESSVNFVFFPFSFQKHLIGNMAKFMAQDAGRTVLLHDSLKVWDTLNERYDLPQLWRDHLPVLSELRKFNPLAYGLSIGEFGGVNRANYEALKRVKGVSDVHDAIANAFLPQAWEVKTEDDWKALRPKVQRIIPLWREAEDLYLDVLREQANTFGGEHLSRQSEIDRGWDENRKLNDTINRILDESGLTYAKVMAADETSPYFPLKQYIAQARYDLEGRMPAWRADKVAAAQRAEERDRELRKMLLDPEPDAVTAAIQEFEATLDQLAAGYGLNLRTDADQLPAQAFEAIRGYALAIAREVPGWHTTYRAYYQRLFGPIERTI